MYKIALLVVVSLLCLVALASTNQKAPSGGAASGGAASGGATQMASLMKTGAKVFANNCAVCHGQQGQGGQGIPLAGFSGLSSKGDVVRQILNGGGIMPSFADQFSDSQIAAVATFVRNSWGNSFGPVTAQEVNLYR